MNKVLLYIYLSILVIWFTKMLWLLNVVNDGTFLALDFCCKEQWGYHASFDRLLYFNKWFTLKVCHCRSNEWNLSSGKTMSVGMPGIYSTFHDSLMECTQWAWMLAHIPLTWRACIFKQAVENGWNSRWPVSELTVLQIIKVTLFSVMRIVSQYSPHYNHTH